MRNFNIKDISLTTTVIVYLCVRLLFFDANIADSIIFMAAILNYCHKRFEIAKREARHDSMVDRNMVSIQNQIDEIRREHATVLKIAEDARKIVNDVNINRTFTRPQRQ